LSADLILYAVVAAGLVFWLRSVLGTRHGGERSRPNPFAPENQKPRGVSGDAGATPEGEDFADGTAGAPVFSAMKLDRNMSVDARADQGLAEIASKDPGFDLRFFMHAVQDAFTIIVEAFAARDRATLNGLLTRSVYHAFESVITAREENGEVSSVEIHAIRRVEIVNAWVKDRNGYITVRFVADETNVLRDRRGEILEGNPDRISETVDIWTFTRNLKGRDPAWLLAVTQDEDAQGADHKTVPDAELPDTEFPAGEKQDGDESGPAG